MLKMMQRFWVIDLGGEEVFVAEQKVVSTAATTVTTEVLTLAQALKALKTSKLRVKGIVIQEQEELELVKPKKKDQIRLDKEAAKRLQAKFDKEETLTRKRAQKEQEANIALIET
nr:hypothetical protein [Tanacetum cinerariifolium]